MIGLTVHFSETFFMLTNTTIILNTLEVEIAEIRL